MTERRVVITGMAINTPLGDTLDGFLEALLAGRSAIRAWQALDTSRIHCKIGGDLSGYDVGAALIALEARLATPVYRRLRRLVPRSPWSTQLSMLLGVQAYLDAGLFEAGVDTERVAGIVAGHNINSNHWHTTFTEFAEEPEFIDSFFGVNALDTDHAACISEVLGIHGPIYTVGAACASGNAALRAAVDEIKYHDMDVAMVTGAVVDFSPTELQAMALLGAISFQSFNDSPQLASRPFDVRREGFVPSHGGGVLVLEDLESAQRRRARIYAEVLAVEASSDGSHLPQPSEDGQARLMARVLDKSGLLPDDVGYVSAHATSTQLGDVTELHAIERVFGEHASRLKINAPKSMLGHTCWSAPVVETVAAVLQMHAGVLHPSINIEQLDPEVRLDVCSEGPVRHDVRILMKNSFGFGGINCVSVLRRWDS